MTASMHLLFHLAADCGTQLPRHVLGDFLAAELLFTTFLDAVGFKQFLVEGCGHQFADAVKLHLELHGRALQVLGVVVLGKVQLQGFLVAGLHADNAVLKTGDHTPRAQNEIMSPRRCRRRIPRRRGCRQSR